MSYKTFTYDELDETAQAWARQQVDASIDDVRAYEYNKMGDRVDYNGEGEDPEYYEEMLE